MAEKPDPRLITAGKYVDYFFLEILIKPKKLTNDLHLKNVGEKESMAVLLIDKL
jgi:hypothetical protein